MSPWRTMLNSSPSIFTTVPLYFPVMTLSPALTSIFTSLPSTMPTGSAERTRLFREIMAEE